MANIFKTLRNFLFPPCVHEWRYVRIMQDKKDTGYWYWKCEKCGRLEDDDI